MGKSVRMSRVIPCESVEQKPIECGRVASHRAYLVPRSGMIYVVAFLIIFVYTAILWVIVLALYSSLIEPFDFGPLGSFALKSAVLISVICLSALFFGIAGRLVNLLIWWIGLVVLFRKDMW